MTDVCRDICQTYIAVCWHNAETSWHLDHVLIVYSLTEHMTWKSPGPMCGWVGRILNWDAGSYQLSHTQPTQSELVGSCIPIHAHRCLPDPKCLFYPSGLLLCLSVDHFCLVPVDDMVLFHGMSVMADLWVTLLFFALEARVCVPAVKVHFFLVFLDPQTELPACLSNIWAGAVLARDMIDQFSFLFILDLVLWMNHKVP